MTTRAKGHERVTRADLDWCATVQDLRDEGREIDRGAWVYWRHNSRESEVFAVLVPCVILGSAARARVRVDTSRGVRTVLAANLLVHR